MKTKFKYIASALLCVTALAACGGGGGDDNATNTAPPPTDMRSGSYQLYAVNGQRYQITVDFVKDTYTLTGTGQNVTGTLKSDDGTGTSYTFQGGTVTGTTNNAHVQYTNDLLVGGFNFGSGVIPFVAARKFVTDTSALAGKFNIFGVQPSVAGVGLSRVFPASIAGAVMKVCSDELIYEIDSCPASSLLTYSLTANNGAFTAVSTGETTTFYAAQSGSGWVYLRADSATTLGPVFRIGLPNTTGIANATFAGESNANEALSITTSTTAGVQSYSSKAVESDGTSSTRQGTIAGLPGSPSGVVSTIVSTTSGPASIFAITSDNLGVFVGANAGPLAGYITIGTH